ncbi:MAG: tyrosine-type recombinase/integrase [Lachnospiraceae bacterium]|nr:tyrosine-type recombinase/integrase [Lachnospiraceae bacterium]
MTKKEEVKNNVLMTMRLYLDPVNMDILESVIIKEFSGVDIKEMETLPATQRDINEYIISLYQEKRRNKLSERTMGYYLSTIRSLIILVNKPLVKIDENDIEYFLRMKQKQGNCNVSLNNLRRNISAFFKWMRIQRIIQVNPVEIVEPFPVIEKPIDHMESEDIAILRDACKNKRDRALIEFLRSTAMRSGEIPIVRINDINWSNGELVIFGHKNNRYRTVMLDSVALKYILLYVQERNLDKDSKEFLFTHIKGNKSEPLKVDGIRYAVKQIAKRSIVERNIYPHLFRKTTATQIILRGGSDEIAGEYLGHAPNSVTSKHYTFKGPEHIREIFNKYVRQ